jgi:hypothetical protein
MKSRQLKLLNGLPLGDLLRDYFDASPLVTYSAINKLAKNGIDDRGLDPLRAIHEACDHFLGKAYEPKMIPMAENLYVQQQKLLNFRKSRQISQVEQLKLSFGDNSQVL